ncbi:MAG: hypothetical protein Q4F74_03835 [Synergistaceae bacterium]|nr:hypothetical protein [Synergistaceae bacterium]
MEEENFEMPIPVEETEGYEERLRKKYPGKTDEEIQEILLTCPWIIRDRGPLF